MGTNIFDDLPEVSFIDNMTLEDVKARLLEEYKNNLKEITGSEPVIEKSDPFRLLINSQAVLDMQMLLYIDHCGKMNLLKYAYGDYLEHMGVFKNRQRKPAQKAEVVVRFSIAEPRPSVEPVPVGIMVTADQSVFFETTEYVEIPAGELSVQTKCLCTVPGEIGNGYEPGEITTLVTPSGFLSAVTNVSKSLGGADIEGDDDLRMGIYNAPDKYSVAGPDDAWVALTKDFNSDVEDVKPTTVTGSGVITLTVLMKHGRIPEESELESIREHLLRPDTRTFGIDIQVKAPEEVSYGIELTYYIGESDKERVSEICTDVDSAVARYTEWQGSKIGRDINPDELLAMIKNAGAKRAVITSPVFQNIPETSVAVLNGSISVNFGGVESD